MCIYTQVRIGQHKISCLNPFTWWHTCGINTYNVLQLYPNDIAVILGDLVFIVATFTGKRKR